MKDKAKLTAKQEAFVREYLVDLNGTQAAKRAGYSERTAESQASRLLRNAKVRGAVSALQAKRAQKADLSKAWVLDGLKKNFERAMQSEEVTDREGKGTGVFVYSGQVANRALELIGKELGMFTDRHELSGPDGMPIQTKGELKLEAPKVDTAAVIAILRGAGVAERVAGIAPAEAPKNGNGQH